jgi:acetyl esterase/lipase
MTGAGVFGPLESIPVAGIGKFKVITVDYRQGPEHKFPSASEDVAAVYKALLQTYKPKNIGIYGCSAGGVLTAEATAWIAKEKLPAPGAIGIFCGSAAGWSDGDSGTLGLPLEGLTPYPEYSKPPHASVGNVAYFSDADFNDPLVQPIRSAAILAKFPPTLIITSTRDGALSGAVYTHTQLVKLGVDAELHVWEGMLHGFFTYEPDIPETKEVWNVVTKFFEKHLGA